MRLKKILPIAVGGGLGGPILIFVLLMVLYPNLLASGIVMKKLETAFGGKAEAERVFFGWKSGVEISNLLVQGEKDESPVLKVDSVHLKFAVLSLLKDKVVIKRLVVDRPEMVIHVGGAEAQKEYGRDGAPRLTPAGILAGVFADFSRIKYNLPDIIEAEINDGAFKFVNLYKDESTQVDNLNIKLTGVRPGSAARIEGECDITGGGGQDHAVVSGIFRSLDSAAALAGELAFTSGFAEVRAAADMKGPNNPGTKVLSVSIKGDLQKAIARLGAILPLPKDAKIRGNIDSELSEIVQPGGTMLLEGQTSAVDLYLKAAPFFAEPFSASSPVFSYRLGINPRDEIVKIEKSTFSADKMSIDLSGVVHTDGTVDTNVRVSVPLEELGVRLARIYIPSDKFTVTGDLTGDMKIEGALDKIITLRGRSKVENLDFKFESYYYTDPEVTIQYNLDYNQETAVMNVRTIEVGDGILAMTLEQCSVQLGENGYYQGDLDLSTDIQKVGRLLRAPEFLQLKGVGTLYLDFKGRFTSPFYEGLRVSGALGVGKVIYEAYKVTDISVNEFTLKDNHLSVVLNMLANDTPAEAVLDLDLLERVVNIKEFMLSGDEVNLGLSGAVHRDGTLQAEIHLSAPAEDILARLAQRYTYLGKVTSTGDMNSDIQVLGTIGDVITLQGFSRVKDLTVGFETYKYTDPEVKLQYHLNYNSREEAAHITNIERVSGLFISNLKNGLITLGGERYYQGKLSLDCDMKKIDSVYELPPSLKLEGVGKVDLDLKGPITRPFYKGVSASGIIAGDDVIYDDSRITVQVSDIASERLTLENGRLSTKLDMELDGIPASAVFDVDLALDPYIEAEFHTSQVPVTYVMDGGELSGLITLDVDEARGEGLNWSETLKKTLTASGNLKVEEGRVAAAEILSTVFMGLAEPGVAEHIALIMSDFSVENERIYTKEFYMEGAL